jgi:hypothetical protein
MMMGVPVSSTAMLGTGMDSGLCFFDRAKACSGPEAQKARRSATVKAAERNGLMEKKWIFAGGRASTAGRSIASQ